MGKQDDAHHVFDVHIGGIFAEPLETETSGPVNPSQAKKDLIELLIKTKDKVKRVWGSQKDAILGEEKSFWDNYILEIVDGVEQNITYSWLYPLIFKLAVKKETSFPGRDGKEQQTTSSINAIIFYNGLWFMALTDNAQFPAVDELFFAGPNIRDIFVGILKRNKALTPVLVPPCVIPVPFNVELYTNGKKDKKQFPEYIMTSEYEGSSGFVLRYHTETVDVTDEDIIKIMKGIYFDIGRSLDSFYLLAAKGNRTEDKHRNVLEMYELACNDLQEYIKIPFWNIVKKCLVANALSKNVSNIQVQLVDNRLSQVHILNDAGKIDTFEDKKGILRNMKEYLKECIVKDFNLGTVEYEGLVATLSHIERLTSQHNTIILGLTAIIAALIGVGIGAWLS